MYGVSWHELKVAFGVFVRGVPGDLIGEPVVFAEGGGAVVDVLPHRVVLGRDGIRISQLGDQTFGSGPQRPNSCTVKDFMLLEAAVLLEHG